jgi:hypothetical protein
MQYLLVVEIENYKNKAIFNFNHSFKKQEAKSKTFKKFKKLNYTLPQAIP